VNVKKLTTMLMAAALLGGVAAAADAGDETAREILRIERQSMEGWRTGNPDPLLATLDPGITYIHAAIDKRLEGIAAVKALFESYRGMPLFDSYEISDPKVQTGGNLAVLTYVLVRHIGPGTTHWNGTQVYERKNGVWKVIHTHWSAAD
jgi:hypothetical protein